MLARCLPVCLFLAAAAPAAEDDPVVSTRWQVHGFIHAEPGEEDFTVTVTYKVPGVVEDRDSFGFKRFWSKVEVHASGAESEWRFGNPYAGKCRDGVAGWCNGAANVQVNDTGSHVLLDLSWGGQRTGHVRRDFPVPWSELDKTVKDDEVEIHVAVRYGKS